MAAGALLAWIRAPPEEHATSRSSPSASPRGSPRTRRCRSSTCASHTSARQDTSRDAAHRAERALDRGGEPRPRAPGRLLLPRRRALDDGRPGVARGRLRGVLDDRRDRCAGQRSAAALARRRARRRPLGASEVRLCEATQPREETQMEASTDYPGVTEGEGYAVGRLDDLGDGPGFRKVRKGLGVTAFGVNAIVLPPGIETGFHYHDTQEELYFVHRGAVEIEFGDGSVHRSARAASRASTRRPCASCATRATSTRSTSAPVARTAMSAATGACARARSSASKRCTTSRASSRSSTARRARRR